MTDRKPVTARALAGARISALLGRLHLAILEYQDNLPDEIASIPRGISPDGYPLTLFDDWSWLSLNVASLGGTLDELIRLEEEKDD
jgi:hypothetical protein